MSRQTDVEWSHRVRVLDMERPDTFRLQASPTECRAVAARIEAPAIASLAAAITVTPELHLGRYIAIGEGVVDLTQKCVRTGILFDATERFPIEGYFGNKQEVASFAQAKKKRAEAEGDQPNFVDESEDPEPLEDGQIDLGELAVQCLSLSLNPYPVSPDAPPPIESLEGEKVQVDNPFAILGQLREFMDEE